MSVTMRLQNTGVQRLERVIERPHTQYTNVSQSRNAVNKLQLTRVADATDHVTSAVRSSHRLHTHVATQ